MTRCYGCLKDVPKKQYCAACKKNLWNSNKHITPHLSFDRDEFITVRRRIIGHLSLSGIQDKISLKITDDKLEQTDTGGEYILKPVPSIEVPRFQQDIPANEHLTMQIARQVFKINTAQNGLIKFSNGEPAYVTKRFDRNENKKLAIEDFCQLSNRSEETHGKNYKYDSSCEEAGRILLSYCAAGAVEIEKLFALVLFNYTIGNGDAHLKNFSLIESPAGDYLLSPAYDLISTSVHFPDESRTALELFDDYYSESYRKSGFYKRTDFLKLAGRYGMKEARAARIIGLFSSKSDDVFSLIERSFLCADAKSRYREIFIDRLRAIAD